MKKGPPHRRATFRIEIPLHAHLEAKAAEEGTSVNYLVNELIRAQVIKWCENGGAKAAAKHGRGKAGS